VGTVATHALVQTGITAFHASRGAETPAAGWRRVRSHLATTEFLVGELGGGLAGAFLGAALPLPGILAPVALATLGGYLGARAVGMVADGDFSWPGLVADLDWVNLAVQVATTALACALGAAILPWPVLGSVVGGVAAGLAGAAVLARYRVGAHGEVRHRSSVEVVATEQGDIGPSAPDDVERAHRCRAQAYRRLVADDLDGSARRAAFEAYDRACRALSRAR